MAEEGGKKWPETHLLVCCSLVSQGQNASGASAVLLVTRRGSWDNYKPPQRLTPFIGSRSMGTNVLFNVFIRLFFSLPKICYHYWNTLGGQMQTLFLDITGRELWILRNDGVVDQPKPF